MVFKSQIIQYRKGVIFVSLINREDVGPFISKNVGVSIYDETWTDQSPLRTEKIEKVALCPSHTHLRIYFNEKNFFAIPRTANVSITEATWVAFDKESGLHYVLKRECD